jgi:hypothetical protein
LTMTRADRQSSQSSDSHAQMRRSAGVSFDFLTDRCRTPSWWRRAKISRCKAVWLRNSDKADASNADNTVKGESWRRVCNPPFYQPDRNFREPQAVCVCRSADLLVPIASDQHFVLGGLSKTSFGSCQVPAEGNPIPEFQPLLCQYSRCCLRRPSAKSVAGQGKRASPSYAVDGVRRPACFGAGTPIAADGEQGTGVRRRRPAGSGVAAAIPVSATV